MRFNFDHLHKFPEGFFSSIERIPGSLPGGISLWKRTLGSPSLLGCLWKRLREFICQKDSEFSPMKPRNLGPSCQRDLRFSGCWVSVSLSSGLPEASQPNGQAERILGRNLTQSQGCFKSLPTFVWDFIEISKFLGNVMTLVIWYFPFGISTPIKY